MFEQRHRRGPGPLQILQKQHEGMVLGPFYDPPAPGPVGFHSPLIRRHVPDPVIRHFQSHGQGHQMGDVFPFDLG